MAQKIKSISQEEFEELLRVEGDTVPLYTLIPLHFNPPRPMPEDEVAKRAKMDPEEEENLIPYGMQKDFSVTWVMLMNVTEPCFIRDDDDDTVYILPNKPGDSDMINYALCNAISYEHNAWAYRLSPRFWDPYNIDGDNPLDEGWWYFQPQEHKPWGGIDDDNH